MPLADDLRPQTFDDICGQQHLFAPNAPLRRILESGHVPSLIFYGPPGTGKTTAADIIAKRTEKQFFKINATTASLADVRDALMASGTLSGMNGTLLYIDEIQYFNKKQQQSLLEYLEDGRVTLICSTTENPYFAVYGALLSRATAFEFLPLSAEDVRLALVRGVRRMQETAGEKTVPENLLDVIAQGSGGDVRKALTALENTWYACGDSLDADVASALAQRSGMRFDRDGNEHYDLLSAFQKSIRGSDADAAIFYLCKLLTGGDLLSPCRRLLVIASEDIGLAYPLAAVVTKACVDSALQLGLPEALNPLSEAVILLATSPKSNAAVSAYGMAQADIDAGKGSEVPAHLRDNHGPQAEGRNAVYRYPHNFPDHYVPQQYLPDDLRGQCYYTPAANRTEQAAADYWRAIRAKADKNKPSGSNG